MASNTLHILRYKTVAIGSFFKNMSSEHVLRLVVGVIVGCGFFAGGLFFFFKIFSYLNGLVDIGQLLMNKIISLGFMAIFIMLVISNLVTSITTLYRSPETAYLLSTPASFRQVFAVKFIDNIIFSTWAVMILGLPAIMAYGLVRQFEVWEYIFEFFLVLVPFVVIPGCVGVALAMFMFLISRRVSPRTLLIWLASLLVLGITAYFKIGQPSSLAFNVISDFRVLNSYLGSMGVTSFPFLPSFWISETLRLISSGAGRTLLVNVLALLSTAILALNVLFALADRYYYRSWLASMEYGSGIPVKVAVRRKIPSFFKLPEWLPSDFRAVLAKDLKLFSREPAQWAQFSILLVLLIIYLLNLKYFPTEMKDPFWRTLIGFTNFAFSGFMLATLSVRFVFPNISLEGKSFWAIVSSPMSIRRVFWVKFWSAFIIFLLISEVLAFVSNVMLGLRGALMVLSFISVLLMSVSLTSLSVGMGAVYPRFDEKNPGKIASSAGGMLTTIISLLYVGLMVVIAALPAQRYTIHRMDPTIPFPRFEITLALALMLILNLTTTIVPLKLGLLSMRRRDY
jgi:ABC-2 type transport system permease protein